ncbi:MurR/RpiR family transcriptional regulator [Spiribacter halobius]|uniref:RpiR family transcriptional regulator n=1 Tax=Sediminicurvatus halobius TaxID=2182432 RepID=A0A2U2N081_9GAMM|nr:MurR/RpiR family transcriptional regulator [Spiribacter halobius]PWG62468.1 RpiR family transcriptional regulator [Spiribacter halobius]UEX78558.1 MurR/RpiR family transcriptional regulator [Spiribacter halobius]
MSTDHSQQAGEGPPETLEGLGQRLAAAPGRRRPGRRACAVLEGMLAAPQQAAVSTIGELAGAFGVHASTLTRLAQALGYRGFGELQAVFRRHVAQTGHFYSDQASRLRGLSAPARQGLDLMGRVARDEQANLAGMLELLEAPALEAAAALLAEAAQVRSIGLRQSHAIAEYLGYALGLLRGGVQTVDAAQGIAHGVAGLGPRDALVAVGFAPYTRATVAAAEVVRRRGVPIVAITDGHASPLARHATHVFVAPAGGHFFSNSMAAALVLVEGLLAMVAQRLGDEALRALEGREALIRELGVAL